MNTRHGNFRFFILTVTGLAFLAGCTPLFAQGLGIDFVGDPEKAQSMATKWLSWLTPIATFMGAVRIFAKPLSTWLAGGIQRVVTKAEETPSAEDDKMIDAVLSSKAYFWVAWVVDFALSIKLPAKHPSPTSK